MLKPRISMSTVDRLKSLRPPIMLNREKDFYKKIPRQVSMFNSSQTMFRKDSTPTLVRNSRCSSSESTSARRASELRGGRSDLFAKSIFTHADFYDFDKKVVTP